MKYVCKVCGYVYDEAREKVPFEQLPDTWKCPVCTAPKSEFEPKEEEGDDSSKDAAEESDDPSRPQEPEERPQESAEQSHEQAEPTQEPEEPPQEPGESAAGADDSRLSIGQLAALCSNLARGCEKQYMEEEADLFRQLSDRLTSMTPAVNDASVEMIEASLAKDIEDYPGVRQTVDADKDRGAARALTWGEKVTRMLSSLVDRYLKEGEAMLDGQDVWLCTICGFIYVGNDLPEICPVCKVPSWKFEKIEGRA